MTRFFAKLTVLGIFTGDASAAECGSAGLPPGCPCAEAPGNGLDYHIVDDPLLTPSFLVDEIDAIAGAAEAWSVMPGVDWTFSYAGTTTATPFIPNNLSASATDGINQIVRFTDADWMRHPGLLSNWGSAARREFHLTNVGGSCVVTMGGGDIYVRDSWTWAASEDLPTAISNAETSFAQTMLHELGHVIFFGHESTADTLMAPYNPHGGNPGDDALNGGMLSVHTDEYTAWLDLKPGGVAGTDYMLFKWQQSPGALAGRGREVWTDTAATSPLAHPAIPETWDNTAIVPGMENPCPGMEFADSVQWNWSLPVGVLAAVQASAPTSMTVAWYLVDAPGQECSTGHYMGAYTTTVTPGVPLRVNAHAFSSDPNLEAWCIPSTVSYDSDYHVCATVADSDATPDNQSVYSDKVFTTSSQAACCPLPTLSPCDWEYGTPVCP